MLFGVPSSVTECLQPVTELGTPKKHGHRSSRDDTASSLYKALDVLGPFSGDLLQHIQGTFGRLTYVPYTYHTRCVLGAAVLFWGKLVAVHTEGGASEVLVALFLTGGREIHV